MKPSRTSQRLFARASQILPGGVDSPVRAFASVGGSPLFIRRASGATIEDVDRNTYIDYVMSWGPLIHGHAPPGLVKAVGAAARLGTSFGAPCALEHELGERVQALMPSIVSGAGSGSSTARVPRRPVRLAPPPRPPLDRPPQQRPARVLGGNRPSTTTRQAGVPVARFASPARSLDATRSSSSRAVITATRIRSW